LHPAQEQLLRAAIDEPLAEVAADVVRPVREPGRGGGEPTGDEYAQRPEVARLVAAPQDPGRLLAVPARAPEQHAPAGMHLVERALHALAVQPSVGPRAVGAGAPVGELHVGREVVALAVVGLDALD